MAFMRRHWVALLVAVLAVGLLIGFFAYLRHKQAPAAGGAGRGGQNGPVAVSVATAASGDIQLRIPALGTVTPLATVTVRTQISGVMQKILFTEGQTVHQGDALAQIDPRPYEAALQQMQGNLQRDQALLADARLDLKRYEGLVKEDSIAEQQLDTQRALVDQYIGTIESDEGQVKTASVNLHVHAHRLAGHRPRRIAPGRSRKLRHAGRRERHRRDQPAAADHRHLPHPRGQCDRRHAAAARRRPR